LKRSYFTLGSILILLTAAALPAQTLSVDKPTLAFSAQFGGAPVSQTINVTSSSGSVPFIAFNNNVSWLKVNSASSASGTTPSALTVTADPTGLALSPTPYSGTLSIFGGTSNIPVTVTLTVGAVSVSPASVAFTYQMGANTPQSIPVNITSAQTTTINLAATTTSGGSWLQVSPTTGTSPGTANLSVNQTVLQSLGQGTYNGTVTITPTSGANTAPVTVSVTLTVTPAPPVTASPAAIALNYQIGGANNSPQQTVTLATTGSQGVAFALSTGVSPNPSGRIWFTVNPSGGTIPATGNTQVTVAYDTTANLPAGTYNGTITLSTPGGTPAQQTIPVTLLVSTSPLVSVANAALTFNYQLGTAAPASQNVTVSSTSSTSAQLPLTISYTPQNSWLSAPATGFTGAAFAVSVNPIGLQPGTYTGTINITATGAANGPLQIAVTLVVSNNPVIVVSTNGCSTLVNQSCPLLFADQIGQTAPAAQNISIASSTLAALNYTVTAASSSCGGAWLLPGGATSGTTNATVPIGVSANGVAAGSVCNGNLSIAATIAATGAAAPNSPLTIPVTMYVSNSAMLVVNPNALSFTAPELGQSPGAQFITLASTSSTDQLTYTVNPATSSGGNWLFVSQVSGSTAPGSNSVQVLVAPGLLSPGTYSGTIAFTATGPGGAAVADSPYPPIPVTFQVTAGSMTVSPATLSFTQTAAGSPPAAQTISVSSSVPSGAAALSFNVTAAVTTPSGSVNWLTATPANGTTPGSVSVTVDGSKLPAGVYNGAVTITAITPATLGSPATIPVTLTVLAGTISATPPSLTFGQVVGGPAPAAQAVTVTGTPGAISVTAVPSEDSNGAAVTWLSVTPTTGTTTPATLTVSANAGSLPVGTYTGKVTITAASPGANGSPITIPVTLNVVTGQTLSVTPATLNFSYSVGASAPSAQTVQVAASGTTPAPFSAAIATTPSGGAWLQVSPASGTTPATLSVTVSPTGLAAGNYTGTVTISSTSSLNPVTVTVTLAVSTIPTPVIAAIGNAASYATGAVAPGENIVIFGTGIGPATLAGGTLTTAGAFSTTAGNTQVTFDGIAAPVIYASATQTSVMVPYGVSGRTVTTVRISYQGVQSNPLIYNVTTTAPGIYTQNSSGTGPGVILNQDYSENGPTKPAATGSVVAVYMTGEGATNTTPPDGAIAPVNGTGLYKPLLPVTATIGGIPATVQYYGTSPGIVYGVMQVNLTIPAGVSSGPQPVAITVGTTSTQAGVTVAVQ